MASKALALADERVAIFAAEIAALEIRLAGARAVVNSTHWHEAGHAVTMVALGCPPDSVTVIADANALGRTARGGVVELTAGDVGAIYMAGLVAQTEYLKRAGLPCDEETLAAAASSDRADIAEILLANAFDCDLSIFLKLATARAEKFIEEHWPAIERVASDLLEHETLNREEIEAAFNGAETARAA